MRKQLETLDKTKKKQWSSEFHDEITMTKTEYDKMIANKKAKVYYHNSICNKEKGDKVW